jgi:hypothetical protein
MSEKSPFDDLIAKTVAEVDHNQDREITAVAQSGLQADLRRERSGDYENQLATEVDRMHSQLRWLHEHPMRRRLMGRTAVQLVQGRDAAYNMQDFIQSPILLEQAPTVYGDHVIRAGYVFSRAVVNFEQPRIHVDQAVQVGTTGDGSRKRLYDLSLYSDELGPRVHVEGAEFTAFRNSKKQELLDNYKQQNSWAKAFTISEGVWSKDAWIGDIHAPQDLSYLEEFPEDDRLWEGWRKEMMIEDDVPKLLKRGNGWDFQPEMFVEPLHLLGLGNAALEGRK